MARFCGFGTELSSVAPKFSLGLWPVECVVKLDGDAISALRELNEDMNSSACGESPSRFFK